jgi:hypothetical protein
VAITRKNFMFVGSDRGGDRAAIFYTLIETAKLNGLDPEAYIAQVIDRMGKGHASKQLHTLLPWNFTVAEAKASSQKARSPWADAYRSPGGSEVDCPRFRPETFGAARSAASSSEPVGCQTICFR